VGGLACGVVALLEAAHDSGDRVSYEEFMHLAWETDELREPCRREFLIECLENPDWDVRLKALDWLALHWREQGFERGRDMLEQATRDPELRMPARALLVDIPRMKTAEVFWCEEQAVDVILARDARAWIDWMRVSQGRPFKVGSVLRGNDNRWPDPMWIRLWLDRRLPWWVARSFLDLAHASQGTIVGLEAVLRPTGAHDEDGFFLDLVEEQPSGTATRVVVSPGRRSFDPRGLCAALLAEAEASDEGLVIDLELAPSIPFETAVVVFETIHRAGWRQGHWPVRLRGPKVPLDRTFAEIRDAHPVRLPGVEVRVQGETGVSAPGDPPVPAGRRRNQGVEIILPR
jgi:hypothetical protein